MNSITRPNNYILPIIICVVVAAIGFFGLSNVDEKNNIGVGLFSGGACIGSISAFIGIVFFIKSKNVLKNQTKRYESSKDYWRSTNPSRYHNDNQNDDGQNKQRAVSRGGYSKPYRNPAKGSNSGRHIQNRNDDGTYNDKTNHYFDTWDYPEQSLGSQLLERVHDEYGVPGLNSDLCTENFSGDVAYTVNLNGDEYKYVQKFSEGQLVDEHVEDRDGYSLENYEND